MPFRVLPDDRRGDGFEDAAPVASDFLDILDARRQSLIMELRAIDAVLVKYGRLRSPTLPTRVK